MTYRFLDHTADAGLEISAASLPELFSHALRGMSDVITDVSSLDSRIERRLEVSAGSLDLLLLEFLSEALVRFDVDGEIFASAEVEIAEDEGAWSLEGVAQGEVFDSARHPARVMIKAVTYHELSVQRREGAWWARVIFDI